MLFFFNPILFSYPAFDRFIVSFYNLLIMKQLKLIYYPEPSLMQPSNEIKEIHPEKILRLVAAMEKIMKENNGIGLAAPQVGINIRLAIVQTKEGILILINPVIIKTSKRNEIGEEGCLSIPGVFGDVRRPAVIHVETQTVSQEKKRFRAKGLLARVIQHEIDHLNGILFIQRALRITTGKDLLDKMKAKK